jgi:hypothetical protein
MAIIAAALPASAADEQYHTCTPNFFPGKCKSAYVHANSAGNYITVSFLTPAWNRNTPSHWHVRDVDNGNVVAQGDAWSTETPSEQTIYGLHGTYQLVMSGSWSSQGAIRNFGPASGAKLTWEKCTVWSDRILGGGSCESSSVEAHGTGHWVRAGVYGGKGSTFRIRDMETGVTVCGENTAWEYNAKTDCFGLYGHHYRVEVTGGRTAAIGWITNF